MENEKLIYASSARKAILKADPKLAYCIDSIPGVDAVEVVRCKDCKHRAKSIIRDCYYCSNSHQGLTPVANLKDYDFCPYGERREGECSTR